MSAIQPLRTGESPLARGEIQVDALTKTYHAGAIPIVALDRLDLHVPAGQSVAVAGPSGSGKSTLLHLLGAMDTPTSGTVQVGAHQVTALRGPAAARYRSHVGFVFQRFHLLPALTAIDNVLAPVMPRGVSAEDDDKGHALLQDVGLGDRARALPSELSGGQQQRVAIARAMINDPELLLADEPTGNLDSHTGAEILELLFKLQARTGTTIIIATHDTSIAERCHQRLTIIDGHLQDDGQPPAQQMSPA